MTALPLVGKRVLVTRAAHQAGKLSEGLRALGAEPVEVPVIEIRPPSDFAPLDRVLRTLDSYDWLILTSANTVHALAERAAALDLSLAATTTTRFNVAAVGKATAEAARQVGFAVALVHTRTHRPPNSFSGKARSVRARPGHPPSGWVACRRNARITGGFIPCRRCRCFEGARL
jgi:hypothetical protein